MTDRAESPNLKLKKNCLNISAVSIYEMEKKVFSKPLIFIFFFSEKEDVTVNDELVIYIYASLFLFKIASCKATSH